jgi:hypothetical protein
MGIMRGHAGVNHVSKHVLMITDLEFLRVRVESELMNDLNDSTVPNFQIFDRIIHGQKLHT